MNGPGTPDPTIWRRFATLSWRLVCCVLVIGLSASAISAAESAAAESKPNVVFILAEDLGWSDTTLFETTKFYQTPNIERLAARGMTFSRSYASSPLCSPTRSSILTGLSPARTDITAPVCHLPTVLLEAAVSPTGPPNQKATLPQLVTRLSTEHYSLGSVQVVQPASRHRRKS